MKFIIAIASLGAATLSFATQAEASKLSPPSTHFYAVGQFTLTQNGVTLTCTEARFSGDTNKKGKGHITAFSASGQTNCYSLVGSDLPWPMIVDKYGVIKFLNVQFGNSRLGINCGPGTVRATDNGSGAFTFHDVLYPGRCIISGMVQSTPPITIVPD